MWRKRDIQNRTTHNAHLQGIRVNRICAYNTSKLAFDRGFYNNLGLNYNDVETYITNWEKQRLPINKWILENRESDYKYGPIMLK